MIRFASLTSFVLLTFLLGCSQEPNSPAATGNRDPAKKAPPAADLVAQEKELADLERQIAAKEKELADLKSKAETLREKIAAAKGAGGDGVIPLAELLGKLPKDLWPQSIGDSLKWAQAEDWYKKNIVGTRASWSFAPRGGVTFKPDANGKFNAVLYGETGKPERIKFGGVEFPYEMERSLVRFQLTVNGLSTEAAEKLRSIPREKALEITFTVKAVQRPSDLQFPPVPTIVPANITIKGIGP